MLPNFSKYFQLSTTNPKYPPINPKIAVLAPTPNESFTSTLIKFPLTAVEKYIIVI